MKITLDQIMSYEPCYDPRPLARGEIKWQLSDLLRREDIPLCDRVWLACQHLARVDRKLLVRFASRCAAVCGNIGIAGIVANVADIAANDTYAAGVATYVADIAANDAAFNTAVNTADQVAEAEQQKQLDWICKELSR